MLIAFTALEQQLTDVVVGQPSLVQRLLIALLADGHLLVEGAPGLAKTRAVRSLANLIEATFQRIQFTPDLLPSDITGTEIFRPEDGSFEFQHGPVFNNLVLADEINRAPAKVQSALLEAMAEKQVSFGKKTLDLPELFLVMATQNSIEQEGTYRLPEAQLDRFLLQIKVSYPDAETENRILEISRTEALNHANAILDRENQNPADQIHTNQNYTNLGNKPQPIVSAQQIFEARAAVMQVHVSKPVQDYIVQLVLATRSAQHWSEDMAALIEYGASPRATIALDKTSRARAWLAGRDFVTPDDVQAMLPDCLRHRIIPSLEADARGIDSGDIIEELLRLIPTA